MIPRDLSPTSPASTAVAYTLRPLDPTRDLPRVAHLMGLLWPVTLAAEMLEERERERERKQERAAEAAARDAARRRTVAVDARGLVVGMGETSRDPWTAPGEFFAAVVVDEPFRRQGVGAALLANLAAFARAHAGPEVVLRGYLRDDRPAALAFATRHGFRVVGHEFTSRLVLADFAEAPFWPLVERVDAAGFTFRTLTPADRAEADLRRLYALHAQTAADVPGNHDAFPPFETYAADLARPHGRQRGAEVVAIAPDGAWVGLALLSVNPEDRQGYNSHTGVLRAWRGRGLAQALKVLAIRAARNLGAEAIRTDNDEANAPMLAINRKLGYQPEPGWLRVQGPTATSGPAKAATEAAPDPTVGV